MWPHFLRGDSNNNNNNNSSSSKATSSSPQRKFLSQKNMTSNRRNSNSTSTAARGDGTGTGTGTGPGVGPASPNLSSNPPANRNKSPVRSENIGASLPIGLNGPTAFQFSPSPSPSNSALPDGNTSTAATTTTRNGKNRRPSVRRQEYVSFLSSAQTMNMNVAVAGQNPTASGSPVRTIGSNPYSGEKRLFVMDLEPIWKEIDRDDHLETLERNRTRTSDNVNDNDTGADDAAIGNADADADNGVNTNGNGNVNGNDYADWDIKRDDACTFASDDQSNYLHEPNIVMKQYVTPLLNTSLPFNRPHGQGYNDAYSTFSKSVDGKANGNANRQNQNHSHSHSHSQEKNLNSVSDKSLSLEENLRRERQRVHSDGVTQFSWGGYKLSAEEKGSRVASVASSPLKERPIPEQKPERVLHVPSMTEGASSQKDECGIRIVVPLRGNIYIQDGVGPGAHCPLRLLYDKSMLQEDIRKELTRTTSSSKRSKRSKKRGRKRAGVEAEGAMDTGAIDPQLSPDGSMIAFVVSGEIYVMSCTDDNLSGVMEEEFKQDLSEMEVDMDVNSAMTWNSTDSLLFNTRKPTQVTFGARSDERENDDGHGHGDKVGEDDDDMSTSSEESQASKQATKKYGRSVTHGLADFVAQEEMDRYQGFWWNEDSTGIIFARVDESCVPPYRITHQGSDSFDGEESSYEEHRYPFAGKSNPVVTLGYVTVDCTAITGPTSENDCGEVAKHSWSQVKWFEAPEDASEYLARVNWLPDRTVCVQWQDRRQSMLLLVRINVSTGETMILHREQSDVWINLHHMFKVLPQPVHPDLCLECEDGVHNEHLELPEGSFSYVFVSERTGYNHLYLYTYVPGDISATLLRAISAGEWIVESIAGVDVSNDLIYFTGTYKSPLEKHLFALPIVKSSSWNDVATDGNDGVNGVRRSLRNVMSSLGGGSNRSSRRMKSLSSYTHPRSVSSASPPTPLRLTNETGMHSVAMDASCRIFVDTCSDLTRPTTTKLYSIPARGLAIHTKGNLAMDLKLRSVLYDVTKDFDPSVSLSPPELLSFPTSDGTETLHAALYRPNPRLHGAGPYPLICAVYGGPHVQRVTRSWCQCADMRVQRLCSMGFAVVKCDNRGSSRRGLQFEGIIKKHLGRVEVLDQVTAVRHLIMKRIADPLRVGIQGWSYGGYLAAMCLCRAPDVFSVGIAGAPVTSWDGYDTHYTERYMGLPLENQDGYSESAVFEHIPNMRGKLLLIHGLIDENVHFRHTTRLINRLVASGKDYDLLLFPDERHSPRRLRDRIYMEKRMCDYFIKNLLNGSRPPILGNL